MTPSKTPYKNQLLAFKLKLMFQRVFILALIAGLLSGVYFGYVRPELNATYFQPTSCNILDKKLEQKFGFKNRPTYKPNFLVSYSVQNKKYQIWTYDNSKGYSSLRFENEAIIDKFKIGSSYSCWYDPKQPGNAVLKKGFKQLSIDDYMVLGVSTIFGLVFCLILIQVILVFLTFFIQLIKRLRKLSEIKRFSK